MCHLFRRFDVLTCCWQSLQVKHVIGNKQSSGGGGFAVHLLDGHIGTKFMAVMTLVVKEGGNDGIAPTPRRYSATKGECFCCFILSPTAVFPIESTKYRVFIKA